MFSTLIESDAARERRAGGTVASVVIHATLIAAAGFATSRAAEPPERPRAADVQYVAVKPPSETPAPVQRHTPPRDAVAAAIPARGFQVLTAPVDIPTVLPEIDLAAAATNPDDFTGRGTPGGRVSGLPGGIVPVAGDRTRTYSDSEVEKQVAPMSGNPRPRYPDMLRAAGVEGRVVAQFVVGAGGRVELDSFAVLESAHDQFTAAVRAVLPRMRFVPAEAGGVAVRQLVQMPFVFSVAG